MRFPNQARFLLPLSLLAIAALPGCTYSLVHDNPTPAPNVVAHRQGAENVDDPWIGVLPMPAVAWLSPHTELHPIQPEDYLNLGGRPTKLVNRDGTLDKTSWV